MRTRWLYLLQGLLPLLGVQTLHAQDKLSLNDCYRLAREHYPAIQKLDLVAKTAQFTLENANKRYLPQVSFSGQASYQSQTISFPEALSNIPGASFPSISKDQYKLQGEVNQTLYDGGSTRYDKAVTRANAALQQQNIEVNLYALQDRINNLFFSILLVDAQLQQNELHRASLQTQVQKAQASYNNGVAFKSNVDELQAEVLNIEMAATEYTANRGTYLHLLSLLTGKTIGSSAQLVVPEPVLYAGVINRPELKAYALQQAVYQAQEKQLRSAYLPQFNAFFQGAYGRPTLNIIENQFGAWYVTGLRLNWALGSLYTNGNQKRILHLNSAAITADKETFLLNTQLDITQASEEIRKYTQLTGQDEQAIRLRQSVTQSAAAQLGNGVITTHEYIQQVNAEQLARQQLILHRMQLLQAQYNQKTKSGN